MYDAQFRSYRKAWGQRSILCTRSQICCFLREIMISCDTSLTTFESSVQRRGVALRGQALGNLMRWVTRLAGPLVKWGRISWYVMFILEDKMSNSFSQLMQFEWCAFGQGHLVHGVILFLQWKGSEPFLQGSFYLNITEITEYSRQNNNQGKLRLLFLSECIKQCTRQLFTFWT